MAIHTLRKTQIVRATLPECWEFFSNPGNLARITPPALDFKVLTELPSRIYPGMMIKYRVRVLLGFPVTWLTEITHVREPHFFADEQRAGPYKLWHHEHFFEQRDEHHVEMRDLVTYALPMGFAGDLFGLAMVQRQLRTIFDFRAKAAAEVFR